MEQRTPRVPKNGLSYPRRYRAHRHLQDFASLGGLSMDWKRLYRIKNNWWRGRCKVQELEITGALSVSPILCSLHSGILITVDSASGLRLWSHKIGTQPLNTIPAKESLRGRAPTTIGVGADRRGRLLIAVGYADGSFAVFRHCNLAGLTSLLNHADNRPGSVSAVAVIGGYFAVLLNGQFLTLYEMNIDGTEEGEPQCTKIAFVQAEDSHKVVSLSLRRNRGRLISTIVYPILRLGLGWCIGVQEMRLSARWLEVEEHTRTAQHEKLGDLQEHFQTRVAWSEPINLHQKLRQCPAALSYSHPYLVATLSDNTMLAYLVTSTEESLSIGIGRRLWGHTSAISGVEVDSRGKTVTVSRKGVDGHDVRVWELEGLGTGRRVGTSIEPAQLSRTAPTSSQKCVHALGVSKAETQGFNVPGWIGFDDEHVVILGRCNRRQVFSCYDFDIT